MPHLPGLLPFVISSHSPMEIAGVISTRLGHARDNELVNWLEDFRRITRRQAAQGPEAAPSPDDITERWEALKEGKRLMSEKLFASQLHGVPVYMDEGLYEREGAYGYTSNIGTRTRIDIDPSPSRDDLSDSLATQLAHTLLHELCHAILRRYSCMNDLCGQRDCQGRWAYENGRTDHGRAWSMIAWAMEQASAEYFGVRMDMRLWSYRPHG